MNLLIRKATVDDGQTIADIIKESMGYENSPALITGNLHRISELSSELILIAEYNGNPVGFIHAEDYNSLYSPPLKEVMSLAVKEKYQNLKIGTQLLLQVEKWADATGRKGVKILSSDNFKTAHKFYKSLGYITDKTQLDFIKIF